jgi:hypothetical protein
MRILWHLAVLLLFIANAASASTGEDVFSGCYSLNHDGEPWIKVENIKDTYFVSIRNRDGWQDGVRLHLGEQQELFDIFEKDSIRIKSSLIVDDGAFALFHVHAGETYGGYKAKTDYITYILIGAASAHKKDCID